MERSCGAVEVMLGVTCPDESWRGKAVEVSRVKQGYAMLRRGMAVKAKWGWSRVGLA